MRIKFLESTRYCENGFDVKQGLKGETKNVAHSAACALINKSKAYCAEPETGNEALDKIIEDIKTTITHIDENHEKLHEQMDILNDVLRISGDEVIKKIPNSAMEGFSVQSALRNEQ